MYDRNDMSNGDEYDAVKSEGGAMHGPFFGSDMDYHVINYKKSPYVIYDNFFHSTLCDKLLNIAEQFPYKKYNDGKSRFEYISLNQNLERKDLRWIKRPLTELVEDANNTNFMVDINSVEFFNLFKFEIGDHRGWRHDCDWFFNGLAFDKKLTVIIELSDPDEYEGGEYGEYMSTIPFPKQHLNRGSVLIIPAYYYYNIDDILAGTRKMLIANVIGPKFK